MSENIQKVQQLFEAFGRKDLPALLSLLGENIEWELMGPETIPFCGLRRGHEGVAQFFADHAGSVELSRFEVRQMIAQDDFVVVLGDESGSALATGKTFENEWAMVFTFRDGLIARWRSYENTAALLEALRV